MRETGTPSMPPGPARRGAPASALWTVGGFTLVVSLGLLDLTTGYELSLALFYLIPIALVSVRRGRTEGTATAAFAGLCWYLADMLSRHPYSNPWYLYWNTGIRLGIFLLAAIVITALKDALIGEREQRQRLEEVNRIKNQFLDMAAHDLRSPLAAVRMFADLIQRSEGASLAGRQREFLEVIRAKSDFMLKLVSDLLDISMIESGRLELARQPTDYAAFLTCRVRLYEVLAAQRGIDVRLRAAAGLPPVSLDQNRIEQVLDNLVFNALKYSPDGSRVTVSVALEDHHVRTTVEDSGPGIPAAELGSIFKEFHKGSVRPAGGDRGTGLGLAIASKIVECHGGVIGAESRPGAGTVFAFTLPLGAASEPERPGADTLPGRPDATAARNDAGAWRPGPTRRRSSP